MTTINQIQDLITKANDAYKTERFEEAARFFQLAADYYTDNDDALQSAEMKNNVSVALLKAGDASGALNAALKTDEVFASHNDVQRQALAFGNQGAAYEALGKIDQAISCYEQSSSLLKEINETDMRIFVLKSLSALQLRSGRQLEAMATMDIALGLKKKLSIRERILQKLLKTPFRMLGLKS